MFGPKYLFCRHNLEGENMIYTKIDASLLAMLVFLIPSALLASNEKPSVTDIIQKCDNKYAGEDQNTIFSISIKNKQGRVQNAVYQRYWKYQKGDKNINDKLSLITLSPPDAKNTAFLQHSFNVGQDKNAEQWLYLPSLRSLRRTTIRDLSDSFLGSDLTFDDIRLRSINEDNHNLINMNNSEKGVQYLVESKPKESTSIYGRKVIVYEENKKTDTCLKTQVTYYNKNNGIIKQQTLSWQKVGKAWLWETVIVKNAQTFGSSTFKISRAKVNTGLDDKLFTTRMLKRGIH